MTHADEKEDGINGFYPLLIGLSLARQRGLCENGEPYYYSTAANFTADIAVCCDYVLLQFMHT